MPDPLRWLDPYAPEAERIWRALDPHSFFLSWGWIENWLACLPRDRAPRLAVWRDESCAFFIAKQFLLRHRVIPSRALYLNVTGIERLDELWLEYNGVAGREPAIGALIDALDSRWDELFLPALRDDALGGVREGMHGPYRIAIDRRVPCHVVDLARVRAADYPSLLSSQTRGQLRRAQRKAGELRVDIAATAREAIAIYDELVALHGALWRAKGKPGAFADPWFDRVHRRLIAQRFGAGEIQLVRVRNASHTIGCLYNFVYGGRVLQYQTGFAMYDDPHQKPGYVSHAVAIAHAAASGHAIYDFLAGDMRYKKSLATDETALVWARVQRRRLRFALEERVVRAVRARRAQQAARTA